jgi:hypothetical protein
MNDNTNTPKVSSALELWKKTNAAALALDDAMNSYLTSRLPSATSEERFDEGRHGRHVVEIIDSTMATLTQLRMRVNLQLEGRDNARAKQLDRILGIAESDAAYDPPDGAP